MVVKPRLYICLAISLLLAVLVFIWFELALSYGIKVTVTVFALSFSFGLVCIWRELTTDARFRRKNAGYLILTGCTILLWIASPYAFGAWLKESAIGEIIGLEPLPIPLSVTLCIAAVAFVIVGLMLLNGRSSDETDRSPPNLFSPRVTERSIYSRADRPSILPCDGIWDRTTQSLLATGRVCLYGRYGSGRTTLLRAIASELEKKKNWFVFWIDYDEGQHGWNARFASALNTCNDRDLFVVLDNVPSRELSAGSNLSSVLAEVVPRESSVRIRIAIGSSKRVSTGFMDDGEFTSILLAQYPPSLARKFVESRKSDWSNAEISSLLDTIPSLAYSPRVLLLALSIADSDERRFREEPATIFPAIVREIFKEIPDPAGQIVALLAGLECPATVEDLAGLTSWTAEEVNRWLEWCTSYFDLEYSSENHKWSMPAVWKAPIYLAVPDREKWFMHTTVIEEIKEEDSRSFLPSENEEYHRTKLGLLQATIATKPEYLVITSLVLFLLLFFIPVNSNGSVIFSVIVKSVIENLSSVAGCFAFILVLVGAIYSLGRPVQGGRKRPITETIDVLRLIALPVACIFVLFDGTNGQTLFPFDLKSNLESVPTAFVGIRDFVWERLASSLAIIVPLGSVGVAIVAKFGGITLVGSLLSGVMARLFRLPGRASLDIATSLIGSYSVSMKLTRDLVKDRVYTWREGLIISMCFSTVSVSFVHVVCSTLDISNLFGLVFVAYIFTTILTGLICSRLPPFSRMSDHYEGGGSSTSSERGPRGLSEGWRQAKLEAARSSIPVVLTDGLLSGLALSARLIGPILVITTATLVILSVAPVYNFINISLGTALRVAGVENGADKVSVGMVGGLFEMYVPALLSGDLDQSTKLYIAIASCAQSLFLSGVGVCLFDLFYPKVSLRDYVVALAIRIPVVATISLVAVQLFRQFGWIG